MKIKSVAQLALCASASLFSALASASTSIPPLQPADLVGEEVAVTPKSPNTAKFHEALKSIKSSTEISGTGFCLLSVQGTTYLVDLRGRYVLRNPVIEDMWSGETIRTGAELEAAKSKVKLENLGLKFNEMFNYSYGKGPVVAVFVDPLDVPESLFHDIGRLSKNYSFRVIPVAFSEQGFKRSMRSSAAQGVALLSKPAPSCRRGTAKRTLLFGIRLLGRSSASALFQR